MRIEYGNQQSVAQRFNQILAVDKNKTELNLVIADTVLSICEDIVNKEEKRFQ